jgi:mannose-6-phosphate isomerase-like protein (cupin superfamily)
MGRHTLDDFAHVRHFKPKEVNTKSRVLLGYACDAKPGQSGPYHIRRIISNYGVGVTYVHQREMSSLTGPHNNLTLIIASGRGEVRLENRKRKIKVCEGAVLFIPRDVHYELIPDKNTLFQYYFIDHKS